MRKLIGEDAVQYAVATGAQLYYHDKRTGTERPVTVPEAALLVKEDPGALSCDASPHEVTHDEG